MSFSNHREEYITIEEMNEHLKYVFEYYDVQYRAKSPRETFKRKAFLEDRMVQFRLTYKKGSKACTYIVRKDSEDIIQSISGKEAFRILSKYYKVPKITHIGEREIAKKGDLGGMSASPLLYENPKYENQKVYGYGYDLNSAYSAAMLGPIPDCSKPMRSGIIGSNEIGFEEVINEKDPSKTKLIAKYSGYSLYIFPLMESPFKRFVAAWYERKKQAKSGSKEKKKAKDVLNMSIGALQNKNPFIRACIITRCNDLITNLMTEDTLFCNTDSIVSRVPLNVPIGDDVGQWKLEHEGYVAYKGANYQWYANDTDEGKISYRGTPKAWFKKDWDILKDPVPNFGNVYKYNNKTHKLEKVKYENI